MPSKSRTYSPRGLATNKPIGLRLDDEHLEQVKNLAKAESRSTANMARILCIEGLKAFKQRHVVNP